MWQKPTSFSRLCEFCEFIIDIMSANRSRDRGSIPGRLIPLTQKMVLDTQQYKGKVEQLSERSHALPYTWLTYFLL